MVNKFETNIDNMVIIYVYIFELILIYFKSSLLGSSFIAYRQSPCLKFMVLSHNLGNGYINREAERVISFGKSLPVTICFTHKKRPELQ